MHIDYFFFYTEANIVCILILVMILINDSMHSTQQEKQGWFNKAVIAFILYFLSDIGWAAVIDGQLPDTRFLVAVFNLSNFVLMSFMAYEWFMFMAASEKMQFRNNKKKNMLCILPMAVTTLVMLVWYAADPYFWISENGELNLLYYPLMLAAPVSYLLVAFAFSMINARKTEVKDEKRQYWLIGIFPLGVIVSGMIQLVSLDAPIFCFGCTIMLLWFYIQNLQTLVSIDALTQLNNRGQIDRFMEQIHYKDDPKVVIMMIDVDRFKHINDTYGHSEGDRALILVSETLKLTCERYPSAVFLGRYGGDEFTIIIQNPQGSEYPDHIAKAIRKSLAEKCSENKLPYDLEVSIGYDELMNKNDTVLDCMIRADEMLYKDKQSKA